MASSNNKALSGSEGAVIKMTLVADETFEEGSVIYLEKARRQQTVAE